MTNKVIDTVYFGKNEIVKKFRHMLDARGMYWDYGITGAYSTKCKVNGIELTFMPFRDGICCSTILTPEQAVELLFGTGTCHMEPVRDYRVSEFVTSWGCVCSSCGVFYEFTHGKGWNSCPNCRKRIVWEIDK